MSCLSVAPPHPPWVYGEQTEDPGDLSPSPSSHPRSLPPLRFFSLFQSLPVFVPRVGLALSEQVGRMVMSAGAPFRFWARVVTHDYVLASVERTASRVTLIGLAH